MNLYNTATTGDVIPGNYYNDGTKWVKIADEANTTRYSSIEATVRTHLLIFGQILSRNIVFPK